jgi:RNA polymerase sigma factor (sigma-70 family)
MQADGFRALIQRAHAGDRQAMDLLLAAVLPDLQCRARRYRSADQPDASAADLVQVACLHAWQKLDQFDCAGDSETTRTQFRAWMLRILDSQGLNALRFRSTQRRKPSQPLLRLTASGPGEADDTVNRLDPAADESTPSAAARGGEQSDLIRRALNALPEEDRAIIELHYFEEVSLRQIAARLQLSEDRVRSRYHSALRRLERELGGLV